MHGSSRRIPTCGLRRCPLTESAAFKGWQGGKCVTPHLGPVMGIGILSPNLNQEASAVKAAAVMARRVLYGVLLDKGCKLNPLHEGIKDLIAKQRLPAMFDDWLPAIKDDGHDAAHPDRALNVSPENIVETMFYTAELLRFAYIEPYDFAQRTTRNAATKTTPTKP
jgi:Domain of unknown function (DUF4145)